MAFDSSVGEIRYCASRAISKRRRSVLPCVAVIFSLTWGVAFGQLSDSDIAALRERGAREGWTFSVGRNPATERPIEALCGLREPRHWSLGARVAVPKHKTTLPARFDWRDEGGCTPIKDQGDCGGCWAFTAIASLECNILIKDGKEVDLSEQWLISCNTEVTDDGDSWSCEGGWWAYDYFMRDEKTDPCGDFGAVFEADFPYEESNATCDCPYAHHYVITYWGYVKYDRDTRISAPEDIKQAIVDYGPVATSVRVNDEFLAYTGGIFNACTSEPPVNHAVLLVGWDDSLGADGCWIVRNSWNSGWGDAGYMYAEYGCSFLGYGTAYMVYAGSDDLEVTPLTNLSSSGLQGGGFSPECQVYTLTNNGADSLDWSASITQGWLSLEPTSGTLAPGASVDLDLCITAAANSLSLGSYYDVVLIRNDTSGATAPRGFTLAVSEPASVPNPGLDEVIRDAIGKPTGPLLVSDLADSGLGRLDASEASITDLTGIGLLADLTYLDLRDNDISDLSPLSSLTGLTELYLRSNGISDVTPLGGLTGLFILDLYDNSISDAGPLTTLKNLQWLSLGRNQVTDITPLAQLPLVNLWLDLSYNQITDIGPLSSLTTLSASDLSFNQIADIAPLSGLTRFTQLSLAGNEHITDVSALSRLAGLTTLDLGFNDIDDVSALSTTFNLETLVLSHNERLEDISALVNLRNLKELGLSNCRIADLRPLRYLSYLAKLYVDNNQIADLSPLSKLTGLEELHIWTNLIEDVAPLAGLTKLKELHLAANGVDDLGPLASLGEIEKLDASVNLITDLGPLVSNSGVDTDDEIDVQGNPLSQNALCSQIPDLLARGVNLAYSGMCVPGGEGEAEGEGEGEGPVPPEPPTAAFSGTPTSGAAPLTVQFVDLSRAGTSPIAEWSWDFGDGGASTQNSPSHTYRSQGVYSVSLAVTTADGADSETKSSHITVTSPGSSTNGTCGSLDIASSDGPFNGAGLDMLLLAAVVAALLLLSTRPSQRSPTV